MTLAHRAAGILALMLVAGGCADTGSSAEVVSAASLQSDIDKRLTEAGLKPKSVTCQSGLPGQPGASTRCDVVLSDTNSIQPVVTLTTSDPVNYAVTPAVSAGQLATAVGALLSTPEVSCQSGLDGKTGAQARCDVTRDGVAMTRTVEVTNVEGLLMSYEVLPSLGRGEVQRLLVDRVAAQNGQQPESASCAGDLQGTLGATTDCTVVTGGSVSIFTLTVTKVDGDAIDFGYAPKG